MASPKEIMAKAVKISKPAADYASCDCAAMKELIARAFSTRNGVHFAHWASKSYAQHEALGYLYTSIINKIDEIVEVFQGKNGLLGDLHAPESCIPKDLCKHVKDEAAWLSESREKISGDNEAIGALLDELEAGYLKAIYRLENLS